MQDGPPGARFLDLKRPQEDQTSLGGEQNGDTQPTTQPTQAADAIPAKQTTPQQAIEASSSDPQSISKPEDTPDPVTSPPLPTETLPPPLPDEAPPDDGWEPVWEPNANAFYFYNRFTGATQWKNPRVPEASSSSAAPPGLGAHDRTAPPSTSLGAPGTEPQPQATEEEEGELSRERKRKRVAGGYNPAIHGNYDPNADYAQLDHSSEDEAALPVSHPLLAATASSDPADSYGATGSFNRFTGRFQSDALKPENFNDENKSKRQMNAFFDVDAAANNHDGRSLKAERQGKKLSKQEVKAFKEKRRSKKEERRRAWLRD
ncbi:hypothetical protein M501DRAFT_1009284 [Patellaria atrata CBS 101060]|uniref:WW domain-containing protein n=1 Tax=Patellaria atrata CBS 101060 TaxID=1346257 RepID=A0A9P4VTC1_9PEZI|nr:hypothetical protein M501DRAFT_1009284 [Patellaria atrata CBS 101060]